MLAPQKTKYRKAHKGKIHGLAKGGTRLLYGSFGIKSLDPQRITARQIEAARRAIVRYLRKSGRMWIRVFPDKPITKKPAEVRMGKGKGSVEAWVAVIKPGRVLYEIDGVEKSVSERALQLASAKLPFSTKIIGKDSQDREIFQGEGKFGPYVKVMDKDKWKFASLKEETVTVEEAEKLLKFPIYLGTHNKAKVYFFISNDFYSSLT